MASSTYLHLLLILLLSSQIISMTTAVPVSRTRNLLHEAQTDQDVVASESSLQGITEDTWEEEVIINGRMVLESNTNDYPGSGANNRHYPRPPVGRH